jgi:plasmid stabilization system protein ParE
MPRIQRTPSANRDFSEIAHYIAEKSLTGAINWIEGFDELLYLLGDNPLIGEPVEHLG